jgi:hypothetical protein
MPSFVGLRQTTVEYDLNTIKIFNDIDVLILFEYIRACAHTRFDLDH